jgi:hypothetical protein
VSIEKRLDEWASQMPGLRVAPPQTQFIADMRKAASAGVGYGWMQQVTEWEWQANAPGAWGPEWFDKERREAAARIAELEGDLNVTRLQRDAKLCSECPRTNELSKLQAELARARAAMAALNPHLDVALQSLSFHVAMAAHGRGESAFDAERIAALEAIRPHTKYAAIAPTAETGNDLTTHIHRDKL